MDIKGQITGIKYKVSLAETLKTVDIKGFNINECPAYCLVRDNNNSFAVSKWVSPKRTRSYPYERVYNTLNISKKITVNGKKMKSKAVLKLTSKKIEKEITSEHEIWDRGDLLLINDFSQKQMRLVNALLDEAEENDFEVKIGGAKC